MTNEHKKIIKWWARKEKKEINNKKALRNKLKREIIEMLKNI